MERSYDHHPIQQLCGNFIQDPELESVELSHSQIPDSEKNWEIKRWEYQTTWPVSWKTYMQVKKQQLELDMEQWAGSKLEKKYIKVVYDHPVYLIYM